MNLLRVRTAAVAVAFLLAVYVPAFAATSLLRPALPVALALIIGISLCLALAIIFGLVRRGGNLAAFGFALPSIRWVAFALGWGLLFALGAAWLAVTYPSPAPLEFNALARWQQVLCFLIAAPVQEEIIFRGLVQTYLQNRWPELLAIRGIQASFAVMGAAILFAVVHLGSGWPTVVGALVLSVLAGELRRRSGSLLPAMVVHSLFNAAAMLMPSA